MYNSFLSFIIALMLTRNSADARNCYCFLVPRAHRALCAPLRMPAETSRLQLQVCALCRSHVLFIEVKKRNLL